MYLALTNGQLISSYTGFNSGVVGTLAYIYVRMYTYIGSTAWHPPYRWHSYIHLPKAVQRLLLRSFST